jgi:hypothetical protein
MAEIGQAAGKRDIRDTDIQSFFAMISKNGLDPEETIMRMYDNVLKQAKTQIIKGKVTNFLPAAVQDPTTKHGALFLESANIIMDLIRKTDNYAIEPHIDPLIAKVLHDNHSTYTRIKQETLGAQEKVVLYSTMKILMTGFEEAIKNDIRVREDKKCIAQAFSTDDIETIIDLHYYYFEKNELLDIGLINCEQLLRVVEGETDMRGELEGVLERFCGRKLARKMRKVLESEER